ncbi:MAG: NYN domain-containing protein [Oscillospiraceae bacterium]|nr:NYN domain-containing protein [Oscillospiraceae bacterium]
MKRLTVGMLAHVDAGKTTLSEAMLYTAGMLRRLGRVDHGDAFLDTDALERSRGITIFAKEARLLLPDAELTLLDTPGHVDFSAEMERTLSVLDYAVLVVSGSEGVQSHTETLWSLLDHAGVPVFVFVNKMDLSHSSQEAIMQELRERLDPACVDFTQEDDAFYEAVGATDEALMESVLETGCAPMDGIARAVTQRHVFPCCFGSALRCEGIERLLTLLAHCTLPLPRRDAFSARVFKITEEAQGKRLTHLKVTGGVLRPKDVLQGETPQPWEEKVDAIRLYSGTKFTPADAVYPGTVCAVTGLTQTFPGQGLGTEPDAPAPTLEPILRYAVALPAEVPIHTALSALRRLEQEDPQLHVAFRGGEITVLLMGEIQLDVLASVLEERFSIRAGFVPAGVAYRETIAAPVQGLGHYEPLRHYAEVRLLLEPGAPGSGVQLATVCREDALDRNWQRLILTHLGERQHPGVLTGSPLTDVKITLLAGRAHKKHTEGGDFRQATYRAVRQGLMQAESVLLEPWYRFRLEVPLTSVGRALTDLEMRGARPLAPQTLGETAVIEGRAPAALMMTYRTAVMEYTHGRGRLTCRPDGYAPCPEPAPVIERIGYDPLADPEGSPDSVFCSHGAGVLVHWDEVAAHMHTEDPQKERPVQVQERRVRPVREAYTGSAEQDAQLKQIFEQTYGTIRRDAREERRNFHTPAPERTVSRKRVPLPSGPEYLLVDGYNIIFAWEELKRIAAQDLDAARDRLVHLLDNYRGYRDCRLIVVFDAYRVKGGTGSVQRIGGVDVVYTKEAETADTYIERISHELAKDYRVRVATSDGMEQIIILGNGAYRMSAQELWQEVRAAGAGER